MPVTLASGPASVQIPDIGSLVWADEYGWAGVAQSRAYCFGGALVVQESAQLAGQPLTLTGGERWAWITQATLDDLTDLLAPAGSTVTVTLDDERSYTCCPDRESGPAIVARPLPLVADSPLVERDDDTWHILDAVRLIILEGPL
jgi:hypothetical protein